MKSYGQGVTVAGIKAQLEGGSAEQHISEAIKRQQQQQQQRRPARGRGFGMGR